MWQTSGNSLKGDHDKKKSDSMPQKLFENLNSHFLPHRHKESEF